MHHLFSNGPPSRRVWATLFAVSGFTGLIYESLWTHYLKLFMGHAAYSQAMVLAIFMGGMAAGAWIVSRTTQRWHNLLRMYALVEAFVGLAALFFHDLFLSTVDISFSAIIPSLGSATLITAYKWSLAVLLIAPQSILLGMTFPLMAGGMVRHHPHESGRTLALLYFSNSLGAAIGTLVSGFWWIPLMGLDGSMRLAGAINLILAGLVWQWTKSQQPPSQENYSQEKPDSNITFFLVAALITGAASFIYEIAWIRMLSLVLGSTFHAFELMLSAFITGIALGGWWLRRRIETIANPVAFLGYVQVIMGVLALSTLALYNHTFTWIAWLVKILPPTDSGYLLFNLGSHAVAFAIMLPTTFCAGITLPLLTQILLLRGNGESSIGRIYAFNTFGSIAGVMAAVHLGLPFLGLKLLLTAGTLLDLGLGVILLRFAQQSRSPSWRPYATSLLAFLFVAIVTRFVTLDPQRMASGVYRAGATDIGQGVMRFHQDGKTATISTYLQNGSALTITTNGKPDATLELDPLALPSGDEITMAMAGALPLSLKPEAKKIVNIGFGSGLTTHVLLGHPHVEQVHSIEIEPAVIAGAQGFMPRVARAFHDPRSIIHFEDAKTWFVQQPDRFDIIVSEPSNPWVNGVGGLFSDEFYRQIRHHLKDDGLLVQWLHLYEFNDYLVASVLGALDRNFKDYAIFNTDNSNVLIIAPMNGLLPPLSDAPFQYPHLKHDLARVGLNNVQDFEARRVGSKALLSPLFAILGARVNSDFDPILNLKAPQARFKHENAVAMSKLSTAPLPLAEMLEGRNSQLWHPAMTENNHWQTLKILHAMRLFKAIQGDGDKGLSDLDPVDRKWLENLLTRETATSCQEIDSQGYDPSLHLLALATLSSLDSGRLVTLWGRPEWLHCHGRKKAVALYQAIARRDAQEMLHQASNQLAEKNGNLPLEWRRYLLANGLLAAKAMGDDETMGNLFREYSKEVYQDGNVDIHVLAILSYTNN